MKCLNTTVVVTVLLLTNIVPATAEPSSCRVVLLPLDQSSVRPEARISEERLQNMTDVQFSQLANVSLLRHQDLAQLVDQALVDDAVFELIVTDTLSRTLARMDGLQSATARAQEQRRVAYERGIKYLIRVSIAPIRRQWHISYSIMDTKTGHIVHARSFYEVDNRPNLVANEIAKRLTRGMWKACNRKEGNPQG